MDDKQKLIAISVVGVLLAAIFGYLIWRTSGSVKGIRADAETAVAQTAKIQREKVDRIPAAADKVMGKRPVWARLNAALPAAIDMTKLEKIMTYAYREAQVAVDNVTPPTEARGVVRGKKTKLKKLSMEIDCSSTFFEFVAFLNIFERQRLFFNVSAFKIAPDTREPGRVGVRRLIMNLYTYDLNIKEDLEALLQQLELYQATKDVKVLLEKPGATGGGGTDAT